MLFWSRCFPCRDHTRSNTSDRGVNRLDTYNGRDGKVVSLSVLEETENVVADDNAGLAGENLSDTHDGR